MLYNGNGYGQTGIGLALLETAWPRQHDQPFERHTDRAARAAVARTERITRRLRSNDVWRVTRASTERRGSVQAATGHRLSGTGF